MFFVIKQEIIGQELLEQEITRRKIIRRAMQSRSIPAESDSGGERSDELLGMMPCLTHVNFPSAFRAPSNRSTNASLAR